MDNKDVFSSEQSVQRRPRGMSLLLFLSFVNACFCIFGYFLFLVFLPQVRNMISDGSMQNLVEEAYKDMGPEAIDHAMQLMEAFTSVNPLYFLAMALLFIVSLIGVIKMYRLKKNGLHFYAIAQILMLIANSAYIYPLNIGKNLGSDLLLTLMFIALYYIYFKRIETQK